MAAIRETGDASHARPQTAKPPGKPPLTRPRSFREDRTVGGRLALRITAQPVTQCLAQILVQQICIACRRRGGGLLETNTVHCQDTQFLGAVHEMLLQPPIQDSVRQWRPSGQAVTAGVEMAIFSASRRLL